jgi:hypothetical protein
MLVAIRPAGSDASLETSRFMSSLGGGSVISHKRHLKTNIFDDAVEEATGPDLHDNFIQMGPSVARGTLKYLAMIVG